MKYLINNLINKLSLIMLQDKHQRLNINNHEYISEIIKLNKIIKQYETQNSHLTKELQFVYFNNSKLKSELKKYKEKTLFYEKEISKRLKKDNKLIKDNEALKKKILNLSRNIEYSLLLPFKMNKKPMKSKITLNNTTAQSFDFSGRDFTHKSTVNKLSNVNKSVEEKDKNLITQTGKEFKNTFIKSEIELELKPDDFINRIDEVDYYNILNDEYEQLNQNEEALLFIKEKTNEVKAYLEIPIYASDYMIQYKEKKDYIIKEFTNNEPIFL